MTNEEINRLMDIKRVQEAAARAEPPPLPVEPPSLPRCVRPPFTPMFEGMESAWMVVHQKPLSKEDEERNQAALENEVSMRYLMAQAQEAKMAQAQEEAKKAVEAKKKARAVRVRWGWWGVGIVFLLVTGLWVVVLAAWLVYQFIKSWVTRPYNGTRDVSLSGGDWGRLGTLSGMNMYKQDQQIAQMKAMNDALEKNNRILSQLTKK